MRYIKKFYKEDEVLPTAFPNVCYVAQTESLLYNVESVRGIYIMCFDSLLISVEEWKAGGYTVSYAWGVAVLTDHTSFIISKNDIGEFAWSSNKYWLVPDIITTINGNVAKNDYAGVKNTACMLVTDKGGAAYSCRQTTPWRDKVGYLPSAGELYAAYENKTAIDEALTLIGGNPLSLSEYWSSTQYDANTAWNVNMNDGDVGIDKKDTILTVRPFYALPRITSLE